MKRICLILLAALMIISLLPAMTSCKNEPVSTTVLFMRPEVNVKDDTTPYGRAALRFEAETGQTVKLVASTWTSITEKLTVQAAAGRAVEVFFTGGGATLWYANKGYAQAWNKYLNLDNPYLDKAVMDRTYKAGGNYYFATAASGLWGIYYNKDMFTEKGLDNPGVLFKKDEWNYDNFLDYCRKFLEDNNGDGEYDVYGLSGWAVDRLLYANNASFCKKDDQGVFSSNLDSINLINGLEIVRTIYNEGLALDIGNNDGEFLKMRAAMFIERDYLDATYYKKEKEGTMPFDYGFVPLPYGPQNNEKINVSIGDGYMLGKNCKNPVGAGKFCDILITELGGGYMTEEQKAEAAGRHKPEVLEIINIMKENNYCFEANDEGLFEASVDIKQSIINESLTSSVSSALEKYKQITEESCRKTNEHTTIEEAKPFESFIFDFNDGTLNGLVDAKAAGVTIENVDSSTVKTEGSQGDIVFDGKSLKLTFNNAGTNGAVEYMKTDAAVNKIVGRRNYYLEFDYKMIGEFTGKLKGKLVSDDGLLFCDNIIIYPGESGEVMHYKYTMRKIETNNDNLYLVFTCENATGTFVIDNFSVTEVDPGSEG